VRLTNPWARRQFFICHRKELTPAARRLLEFLMTQAGLADIS
jgi:hypothetical protein